MRSVEISIEKVSKIEIKIRDKQKDKIPPTTEEKGNNQLSKKLINKRKWEKIKN